MQQRVRPNPGERIYFLDNVRMLSVLAVVALHAGIAYAPVVPWWYVMDTGKAPAFDVLMFVTDGFVMPTLFFISGYFALASLRKHGPADFMLARMKRLGIPLVAVTVFINPVISYVVYLKQVGPEPYLRYWLRLLPSAVNWRFSLLTPENVPNLYMYLWSFHLWYLGILLLFCGLLALGRIIFPRRAADNPVSRDGAGFGLFFLLALAVALAEAAGQVAAPDLLWIGFGPFFEMQPSRLPLYLGGFLLGAYAFDRGWFMRHRLPGRTWLWGVAVAASFAAMAASGMAAMPPGSKGWLAPAVHGLARTLFALAATGFLAVFGQRCWNRAGGVSASLSAASYDIYLAHFPLVVALQYALVGTAASPFVKFGIEFAGSILVCWGASHLAERRRKVWVSAGTLAAFALCVLAWG